MKNLDKRLAKIKAGLEKHYQYKLVEDMTDDELAQVITGDPHAKASDLSPERLEEIIRERKK